MPNEPNDEVRLPGIAEAGGSLYGVPQFGSAPIVAPSVGQLAQAVVPNAQPPAAPPSGMDVILEGMDPKQRAIFDMFYGSEKAQNAQRQAQAAAAAGAAQRKAADITSYLAEPRPPVYQPKYRPLPTPPKAQFRDPMEAVGSPIAGLAMIAGLFTRTAGTATLNAAAAAMKAQREGDMLGYETARAEFNDKLTETLNANQQERQAYLDSWNNRKLTMQEKLGDLEMKATLYQNQAMAASARAGNVSDVQMKLNAFGNFKQFMDAYAPIAKTPAELVTRTYQDAYAKAQKDNPNANPAELAKIATDAVHASGVLTLAPQRQPIGMNAIKTAKEQANYEAVRKDLGSEATDAEVFAEMNRREQNLKQGQKAWSEMRPELQNLFSAFGVKDRILADPFKYTGAAADKAVANVKTIRSTNEAAKFFAENPNALGVLATLYNKYKGSALFATPVIDPNDPAARAKAATAADEFGRKIISEVGRVRLPDGSLMTSNVAELAAIGNKLLMQSALEDAAAMSARGGGTVFLDRKMMDDIYNTMTSPNAMMNFLRLRAEESARSLHEIDPKIDFHKSDQPEGYKIDLLTEQGFSQMMGHMRERAQIGGPPKRRAAPRQAGEPAPTGRPRATNPQTGEVVEYDGQNWVPVR